MKKLQTSSVKCSTVFGRIQFIMERDKPYLSSDFNLTDLSSAVFTNKTYISMVIRDVTGMNFNQFINSYRVNYAKELIKKNPAIKMKDICRQSGFGTDVSLISAFKTHEGLTPGLYARMIRFKED